MAPNIILIFKKLYQDIAGLNAVFYRQDRKMNKAEVPPADYAGTR